jgi:hypothetical protein
MSAIEVKEKISMVAINRLCNDILSCDFSDVRKIESLELEINVYRESFIKYLEEQQRVLIKFNIDELNEYIRLGNDYNELRELISSKDYKELVTLAQDILNRVGGNDEQIY